MAKRTALDNLKKGLIGRVYSYPDFNKVLCIYGFDVKQARSPLETLDLTTGEHSRYSIYVLEDLVPIHFRDLTPDEAEILAYLEQDKPSQLEATAQSSPSCSSGRELGISRTDIATFPTQKAPNYNGEEQKAPKTF